MGFQLPSVQMEEMCLSNGKNNLFQSSLSIELESQINIGRISQNPVTYRLSKAFTLRFFLTQKEN
jgi:hypothetical protein